MGGARAGCDYDAERELEHSVDGHMQRTRRAARVPASTSWSLYLSPSYYDTYRLHNTRRHTSMSDSVPLASVLESQNTLLQEASLALPHQFSQCTYSLGHIRQAVYLCLTCTPPSSDTPQRGICSACSVACHTDHEQLELFPKRDFRCDCPTRALAHPCTLHTHLEEPNGRNMYGRNFNAQFCRCGRKYDAESERETMIQCLACEVRSNGSYGVCANSLAYVT